MLEIDDNLPAGAFLKYAHQLNPSYLDLPSLQIPWLSFHTNENFCVSWKGKQLDVLDSDHGGYEILSDRVVAVLEENAKEDIQLSGILLDGIPLKGYWVVIAPKLVDCLDYETAATTWVKYGELEKVRVDEYAFDGCKLEKAQFVRCTIRAKGSALPGPEVFAPALSASVGRLSPHGFKLVEKPTKW